MVKDKEVRVVIWRCKEVEFEVYSGNAMDRS
jgi:hypothetical protein